VTVTSQTCVKRYLSEIERGSDSRDFSDSKTFSCQCSKRRDGRNVFAVDGKLLQDD